MMGTRIFMAVLFVTTKYCKPPKWPSMGKGRHWPVRAGDCDTAVYRSRAPTPAATQAGEPRKHAAA